MRVDRFGQMIGFDFDQRISREEELQADVLHDADYYGGLPSFDRSRWGSLPGSGERFGLSGTGFFRVAKLQQRFVLVDPDGDVFFSLGCNGIGYVGETYTLVEGRHADYEFLPEFSGQYKDAFYEGDPNRPSFYVMNQIRKYDVFSPSEFYSRSVERMQAWGFNSEGAWSEHGQDGRELEYFPQVGFLTLPKAYLYGPGFFDVYQAGVKEAVLEAFVLQGLETRAEDPRLIGYFFDNEIPYHLFRQWTLGNEGSNDVKLHLAQFLSERYTDLAAFNLAWDLEAESFAALQQENLVLKTPQAEADFDAFFEMYLRDFYRLVHDVFRALDPNHLLLGDRYLASTMNNPKLRDQLALAAGSYLDVLSYNYYANTPDVARLQRMSELSGRPLILSEFHYAEPTSGLQGGVRIVKNEQEKGLAYRNYVEQAAASGVVVGTHWFIYLDQAGTGRWFEGIHGEAFGVGLLNVCDRPYKILAEEMMKTHARIYDVYLGTQEPFHYLFAAERTDTQILEIPYQEELDPLSVTVDDLAKMVKVTIADQHRVSGNYVHGFGAEVYFSWNDEALHIIVDVEDPTPIQNVHHGFDIWNGDAFELFIGPEDSHMGGAIRVMDTQLILTPTQEYYWYNHQLEDQPVPRFRAQLKDDPAGYLLVCEIAWSDLGVKPPSDLRFDFGLDHGSGSRVVGQYLWNGEDGNAQSRERWGIARLSSK